MLSSAVVGTRVRDRVWLRLSAILGGPRAALPDAPEGSRIDLLPSTRLRDLGFAPDHVGGSLDFAKGQHHRHL
jgi:hypothetical protein